MPSPESVRLRKALREHAPISPRTEPALRAAIEYVLSAPGSLSRAQLVMAAGRAHGLPASEVEQLACAVEYYHVASLIMDDLPCMDDADTRRGQPSLHRAHGQATALLTSLALVNRAYSLVAFTFAPHPVIARMQAQSVLDGCLGTTGILDGQARDLNFAASPRAITEASRVALGKTVSLFSLAVFLPALLVDPDPRERAQLKALCVYWGLAYQALDDLRDVLSHPTEIGKPTQRDRELARPNLACLSGVAFAQRRLRRLLGQAERAAGRLAGWNPRWSYLQAFQQAVFDGAAREALAAA
ncbi:hypothetical protein DB347_03490 [Opitutaceae bacterium EW11]|nr:hypothetical protein DB347_03490 [Opitutaceae bacterium EW11]